jgi:hypothetical protein
MNVRPVVLALAVPFAACASSEPVAALPSADAALTIDVAGDGFVRIGERRMPLDAAVLELRQRARKMTADERVRFVVQLRTDPQPDGSEAARIAREGVNRLIDEFQVMGIGAAKVL